VAVARGQGPPQPAAARPNIVSIVTDDQARWSLGCYGNRESLTPVMDRIARAGARFDNAFVATPVCSPSRAAFLTGRYGTQLGITDYLAPVEQDAGAGLPPGVPTWPEVLRKQGYATALIGKWHLGTRPEYHPTRRGFDHFFGFLGGGNMRGSLPDLLVDDAIRFVEANRARPFALLVHFRAPHLPYGPVPEVDSAPFRNLDPTIPDSPGLDRAQVKTWTRDYYASIHSVDRNLGRLLDRLDGLGLAGRTVVLFTSDHGYNIGHHGIHAKGNGFWVAGGVRGPTRPNMWETSIRVPLLVRWPGAVKPGTIVEQPVTNVDTFASVLGMLGVEPPRGYRQEGMDFSPLLRGEKVAWRDTLYGQYDLHNGALAYMRMIRTARWKLVRHYFANLMDEMYDLEKDPDESNNLARAYPIFDPALRATHDDLLRRLVAWQRSIDDPILRDPRLADRAGAK
ncbi:MAG: arylsulfatase, partial [Acidobacteria bacterium]